MISKYHPTPIYCMNYSDGENDFYIKRDDLLPFSFGGNKVRIAEQYFQDMKMKNCDCIIAYGSSRSNLTRVIANMSKVKNIPCYVISPLDNFGEYVETNNSKIVKRLGAEIIRCKKEEVSQTVLKVMNDCKANGLKPYYIYGNIYGKGNEKVAVQAYVEAYKEIKQFEKLKNIVFDYIFLASGTGMTQSGLICGGLLYKDNRNIVGISIARNKKLGKKVITHNISEYMKDIESISYKSDVCFEDQYIAGGYGKYNKEIVKIIKEVLNNDGVPLDTTYTGKAFWGMIEYLKKYSIKNKKILFLHTGGLPLFFDNLDLL